MGNPQVSETRLAWLAGIIDGEGSINMAKDKSGRYNPQITIVNTDANIILEIATVLNDIGCPFFLQQRKEMNGHYGKKPLWEVQIHRLTALTTLLKSIVPWLVGKKAKGMLMLKYVQLRSTNPNINRTYTVEEKNIAEENRHFNDRTRYSSKEEMIQSELRRKLAELAEMTNRLTMVQVTK